MRLVPDLPPEVDLGALAQKKAEAHLQACNEALWAEEDGLPAVNSPASGPYCGCDKCMVREVLWAAWDTLVEAEARA